MVMTACSPDSHCIQDINTAGLCANFWCFACLTDGGGLAIAASFAPHPPVGHLLPACGEKGNDLRWGDKLRASHNLRFLLFPT